MTRPGPTGDDGVGVVRLRFRASASHVRTARLVAVTVARRAGFDEDRVEGVRQAVGEACAMTVRQLGPLVDVTLTLDDHPDPVTRARLVVRVQPTTVETGSSDAAADLGLAVLAGLTDEYAFEHDEQGAALRLTWLATQPVVATAQPPG